MITSGTASPGATRVLQIFATGLGATDPPVASTVGGVNAQVLYQDLAPGFVALYQVSISAVGTRAADLRDGSLHELGEYRAKGAGQGLPQEVRFKQA